MTDKNQNIFVNSYNQHGGITAHTVNVGAQPRHVTAELVEQMNNNVPKTANVTVTAVMGDGEAFAFGNEILQWLNSNGYINAVGVNQSLFSQPVSGQILEGDSERGFRIIIGNRQSS